MRSCSLCARIGLLLTLSTFAAAQNIGIGTSLPPELYGRWRAPFDHDLRSFAWKPSEGFNAIHMALIPKGPHRGNLFVMDREPGNDDLPTTEAWIQRYAIVDVSDAGRPHFFNYTLRFEAGEGDLFCAGHTWSHEGKLLLAGGTTKYASGGPGGWLAGRLFLGFDPLDPTPSGWERYPDLAAGRWYPTVTMLGEREDHGYQRYLILGGLNSGTGLPGEGVLNDYEVALIHGDQVRLDPNRYKGPSYGVSAPGLKLALYPRMVQLSDGQVLHGGITNNPALRSHVQGQDVIDTPPTASGWDETTIPNSWKIRTGGSVVPVPNLEIQGQRIEDRVVLIGGKVTEFISVAPTDRIEWIDALVPQPTWQEWEPLEQARWRQNATILPDGSIVVIGGNRRAEGGADGDPILEPEWLRFDDRGAGSWTTLPRMARPRTYHAAAVLLPDGRVLVGGGDIRDTALTETGAYTDPPQEHQGPSDYQVYEPWYLHTGLEKPVIASLDEKVCYGDPLTVGFVDLLTTQVEKVILMRPGSTTHHNDYDQRYIELDVTGLGETLVTVDVPSSRNRVVPGYWMLFLLSEEGIPSNAGWVHLSV